MGRLNLNTIIVFLLIILFFIRPAAASDMQLNFFSLTRTDGLSNNSVTTIVRDDRGYIWFGTRSGLNRYNGYEFRQYFHDPADSASLPSSRITSLVAGPDGSLWAGCHSAGLARYDSSTDRFSRYRISQFTEDASTDHIVDMEFDGKGRLWVATHGGLFLYDQEDDIFSRIEVYVPDNGDLSGNKNVEGLYAFPGGITSLNADDNGNIWMSYHDWNISFINIEDQTTVLYYLRDEFGVMTEPLSQLFYHDNRLYFAGGHRGIYAFNLSENDLSVLLDVEILRSPYYVTGHRHTLWISSLEGLFRYDIQTGDYTSYTNEPTNPKTISTGTPGVIFVDESDILWLAAGNMGINYSLLNMPFMNIYEHSEYEELLYHPNVSAMLHDSRGNFWVAFQSGVIQAYFNGSPNREIIPVDQLVPGTGVGHIFRLFEASDGTIFMTSWRGGLQYYEPELKRFVNLYDAHWEFYENFGGFAVRDVTEGPEGFLYLAVFGNGVARYDRETGHVLRYSADPEAEGRLSNNFVYDLEIDSEGNLWASTTWGLNRLPPGDSLFSRYLSSLEEGPLIDDYITLSFSDSQGRMWFVTEGGLNLYDPERDRFVNLHVDDLGYTTLVIRGIEEEGQGNLWLSTSHGIINVRINYPDKYSPQLEEAFGYDISHGLLSDDYFTGSSSRSSAGLIFFGGNRGIDFFNPASILPAKEEESLQVEGIRIFDRLVYPGSEYGPPVNEQGEILLTHTENMIGIQYAMLNFIDSPKNKYFYMLEPLHGDWVYAGGDRYTTFANLSPGRYTFRVKSCPSDRLCDSNEAVLLFFIKPPFWKTWPFYMIAGSLFLLVIYLIYLARTRRLRETKAELERLVEMRTHEISMKNRELTEKGEVLTEANMLIKEKSIELEERSNELGRQATELKKANEQLESLNSMKDKFFSIIAHDLRSPLSAVSGLSDLLIAGWDGYDDDKRIKLVGVVGEATRNTITMLDNLLQWANSQTGRLKVKNEEVAPMIIVDGIHNLYREVLEGKGISFSNSVPGDFSMVSDKQILSVIFRNLISNAIKFTQNGGKVFVNSEHAGNDIIRFDITDTGIGFPVEVKSDVFRIDKASVTPGTDGEKGSGLGLILCHEFVSRLGGEIWVEDTSQKGTTISFTLPMAGPPGDQAP